MEEPSAEAIEPTIETKAETVAISCGLETREIADFKDGETTCIKALEINMITISWVTLVPKKTGMKMQSEASAT